MEKQRLLHREGMLRGGKEGRVVVEVRDKNWYCQVQKHLKKPHIFSKADSKSDYFSCLQHLLLWLLLVFLSLNMGNGSRRGLCVSQGNFCVLAPGPVNAAMRRQQMPRETDPNVLGTPVPLPEGSDKITKLLQGLKEGEIKERTELPRNFCPSMLGLLQVSLAHE